MHLHQILTGAANPSDYSFAAGSIDSVHFVVSSRCLQKNRFPKFHFPGIRSWLQYCDSIG